jgi:CHAP domain-containing protein
MSFLDALSRVEALQQLVSTAPTAGAVSSSFADALASAAPAASTDPTSGGGAAQQLAMEAALTGSDTTDGTAIDPFTTSLLGLTGSTPLSPLSSTSPASTTGQRALEAAEGQLGVSEQPPGSNDGPGLAQYRDAVAGASPGEPWCAYFASWAAAQAGAPIGANGQGLGSVAEITDWAGSTGRLLPSTATPQPGDLMLFGDRHVGLVESVNPNGTLTTVEGNYANAVSRVTRSPGEATGYVRL